MSDRAISVIIPTYNRTHFLDEAVESVLAQTRSVAEILIIDDGSDPRFKKELQRISRRDRRIAVHALPEHQGVSFARNRGLEIARGDYVLFLDDDDLVPPTLFATSGSELDADESLGGTVCSYRFQLERAVSCYERRRMLQFDYRQEGDRLLNDPLNVFLRSCPPIHALLLRRNALRDHRFPEDLIFGEDWYFWLSLASRGCTFKFRGDVQVSYRRHAHDTLLTADRATVLPQLFRKLQDSGMLRSARDQFLITARKFHYFLKAGDRSAAGYFVELMKYPACICYYLKLVLSAQTARWFGKAPCDVHGR